jgi:hypothetical protein
MPPRFGARPLIAVARDSAGQVGATMVQANDAILLHSKGPIETINFAGQDIDSNPRLDSLRSMEIKVRREGAGLLGKPAAPGLQFKFSFITGPNRRFKPDASAIGRGDLVSRRIDRGDRFGSGRLELMSSPSLFRQILLCGSCFLRGFIDPGLNLGELTPQFVDLNLEFADPPTFLANRGLSIITMASR